MMTSLPHMIGNEIKRIRKQKKMTQKELCEGICSQAEISKIENGRNSPTIDLLQQIAKRLRVPLSLLFRDQLESDAFRETDNHLSSLFRERKYKEMRKEIAYTNSAHHHEIFLLKAYFSILLDVKTDKIDYRTASVLLSRLTDQEDIWYESPKMYIRIKMAISNLHTENEQYHLAEKVYEELEQLPYDTEELKKQLIKIYYNHSQLLTYEKKYDAGLKITEKGLKYSLSLNDASFIAHFYYQRGYYHEVMGGDTPSTRRDYTISYALFRAFHLNAYEEIVLEGKERFLLFTF
ncbi:helix-turn-helix domain-containing protein [Exiguobacterium antarcticum]|uniref:Helix-turn-helix domain-containing protein n=1 Tax=Exiguobacterium antarcticum TaxID=132920 RepID=A0ABT6R4N0_9BACL|nr:helix-turn-helix domain-containing protein [Exiguobacterium antarcticum]MDI3235910.1 helix-turn-helix domain-containing protein [Exiguobacterium antarcticum]